MFSAFEHNTCEFEFFPCKNTVFSENTGNQDNQVNFPSKDFFASMNKFTKDACPIQKENMWYSEFLSFDSEYYDLLFSINKEYSNFKKIDLKNNKLL